MPYRDWRSLVSEDCVREWGEDMNPNTAMGVSREM